MKISRLNQKLTSERVYGISFPFPPVAIPVDSNGLVTTADLATSAHYATIVLVVDENNAPAILEFSKETLDGLMGYARRHDGLSSLEILISRDDDGKMRIRTGRVFDNEYDLQMLAMPYNNAFEQLYKQYSTKVGIKLKDIN